MRLFVYPQEQFCMNLFGSSEYLQTDHRHCLYELWNICKMTRNYGICYNYHQLLGSFGLLESLYERGYSWLLILLR